MQNAATSAKSATSDNPPIHLIDVEYDIIADLALGIERRSPELSKMLLDEIDRAEIHTPEALPPGVVTIGSEVEVLDTTTGGTRRIVLVLPADAESDTGRVSILTPMGAGLIGLRKGQSINWPCSSGRPRILEILDVIRPAGS